jgi:cytochrome c oxidase subunit 2
MDWPMHQISRRLISPALALVLPLLVTGGHAAHAQTPRPWEIGMQAAHSPVQTQIESLHHLVLIIITFITLLVAALLGYVIYRFSSARNPNPTRTSHNTVLEVAWTVVPVLILVIIAIPSFKLVYFEDRGRDVDLTIKVTGQQWQWQYEYPDNGDIQFTSYMVQDDALKPGQLRLLAVDKPLVLPVGKTIRILTTSNGVIHSFFIPSLGVQRYAIPGRTIETWVKIDKPGDYYGECNQICGANHSRMPIDVHAVTEAEFEDWVKKTKAESARNDVAPAAPRVELAQAQQ